MGFVRKFFWGVAFSATMMIISSQLNVPAKLLGKLTEIRELKQKVEEYKRVKSSPNYQGEPRTTLELEAQNAAKKLQEMVSGETVDHTVGASDMEYLVDGKKMVLINGKYYEARADNIYMVNGERVFYVNDRSRERGRKVEEGSANVSSNASSNSQTTSAPPGFTANPAQMMVELQKMQKETKERNEFLDQLMKEEPGQPGPSATTKRR